MTQYQRQIVVKMLMSDVLNSTFIVQADMFCIHDQCSCCYFSVKSKTLENAEETMLELYCERSQIKDGHTVLDVGCGWGSLSLYIAQKYSNCRVTGICNSTTQKAYIEEQCRYATLITTTMPYDYIQMYTVQFLLYLNHFGLYKFFFITISWKITCY